MDWELKVELESFNASEQKGEEEKRLFTSGEFKKVENDETEAGNPYFFRDKTCGIIFKEEPIS